MTCASVYFTKNILNYIPVKLIHWTLQFTIKRKNSEPLLSTWQLNPLALVRERVISVQFLTRDGFRAGAGEVRGVCMSALQKWWKKEVIRDDETN